MDAQLTGRLSSNLWLMSNGSGSSSDSAIVLGRTTSSGNYKNIKVKHKFNIKQTTSVYRDFFTLIVI